eukprot:TRINITY_DN17457_c0_g1_i1.p1 TRINITY_DN17457_c0_g1~~TRINITY_DN17457_c0_g1_i1.p1  ORF type:complete len:189 (+),score=23.93 TRINITY_DN17457_c0_g1_i1:31-597(+)
MDCLKMTVVGDGGVGKTCMVMTFAQNQFPQEYVPTVYGNLVLSIEVESIATSLRIYDTAGEVEYDRLRPLSYQNTHLFLLCFSVVDHISHENIPLRWSPELSHCATGVAFILVGTKIDRRFDPTTLENLKRQGKEPLTWAQGEKMAKQIGAIRYLECSALTRHGLKELFEISVGSIIAEKSNKKCIVI